MQPITFSLVDTLHILALFPCLFAIALLVILGRDPVKIYVPILFFVVLSSSFLIGLSNHELLVKFPQLRVFLIWMESMLPAVCFLLILQLWRDRFPEGVYWLILALPLVGGTSLVYATLQLDEACVFDAYCLQSDAFRTLYQLFATGMTFLLLTVHLSRTPIANSQKSRYESHRYWLIITLIMSFIGLLVVDLAMLAGHITPHQSTVVHVVIRICFLYLVMTSLFRVFDHSTQETYAAKPKPVDPELIAKIEQAMQHEQLYREMGFSREKCAARLDMQEHVLSRAINQAFGKNFNEFVNSYRIEEAKERLVKEETSITAIAFEVGFSSIASFNRVFKTMVGCSPTEYRASGQLQPV